MATYYIDPSTSIVNRDGSQALPWKNISEVTGMIAGDSLLFRSGLPLVCDATITVLDNAPYGIYDGTAKAVLNGGNALADCFDIDGVSGFTIQNLEILDFTSNGVSLNNAVASGTISDCYIHHVGQSGIDATSVSASGALTLTNIESAHNGLHGISTRGTLNVTATSCYCHDLEGSTSDGFSTRDTATLTLDACRTYKVRDGIHSIASAGICSVTNSVFHATEACVKMQGAGFIVATDSMMFRDREYDRSVTTQYLVGARAGGQVFLAHCAVIDADTRESESDVGTLVTALDNSTLTMQGCILQSPDLINRYTYRTTAVGDTIDSDYNVLSTRVKYLTGIAQIVGTDLNFASWQGVGDANSQQATGQLTAGSPEFGTDFSWSALLQNLIAAPFVPDLSGSFPALSLDVLGNARDYPAVQYPGPHFTPLPAIIGAAFTTAQKTLIDLLSDEQLFHEAVFGDSDLEHTP